MTRRPESRDLRGETALDQNALNPPVRQIIAATNSIAIVPDRLVPKNSLANNASSTVLMR